MALEVKDLKIYYKTLKGYVKAVDGVSFRVKDGEILGIAGESGCGKSTLGNSLVLLKPPMNYIDGEVIIDDQKLPIADYEKMRSFRYRKIAIIPQYAMDALNPTRKIGRMLKELFESIGVPFETIIPKIKERLKIVNLPQNVLDMYPIELSGGMKQRMVMVIASLMDPSVMIADEITSALDVSSQKAVVQMLREFRKRGFVRSLLFITHDISVLYQIADTVMIMYAGKVAEIMPMDKILRDALHPYTRLLISSLPEVGIRYTEKLLEGIPGQPPNLLNPPEGCRFKDRCPAANERCFEEPPFIQVEENHWIACWREVEKRA
ncbi:MAG: peptide/nickel transport system ATP-binding protein [Thermotogota bacterium]|nr:peptide/nickel transport system ATP-binding protein [Thermotogota bacterium]